MDQQEDFSQQNTDTAGHDNDEVDGGNICGLRMKKGVRVTKTSNLPLGREKVEVSYSADPTFSYNSSLQRTTGPAELQMDLPCQKPCCFPQMPEHNQGRNDSTLKEDNSEKNLSEETQEACKDDKAGRVMMEREKKYKEVEASNKEHHQPLVTEPRCKDKVSCSETAGRDVPCGPTKISSNENKCGRKEEENDKISVTMSNFTVQEKDTEEFFAPGPAVSMHTPQEQKNWLSESLLLSSRAKYSSKSNGSSLHPPLLNLGEKTVDKQDRSFETSFPLFGEEIQTPQRIHNQGAGKTSNPLFFLSSAGSDQQQSEGSEMEHRFVRQPTAHKSASSPPEIKFNTSPGQTEPSRDPDISSPGNQTPLHLVSQLEHIKQQMARDSIQFIRFEATDLHGVSRSKSIPSRFFHEKATHGVSMPRGYLELTLNPKDNEVGYISSTSFHRDIILSPDLSTFRVLPWTEQTARVICDPFTVLGKPVSTSPRYIAKQQLSQLQDYSFSLYSAFTYEFCIYGIAEVINSKTISFPAATLLNNQDQTFVQELIEGMYYIGVNIESFSSSTGPGQMEISFHPEFGIEAADSAFAFRTGIKEVAKKYNYIASFFSEIGFYNSGILAHSLWDVSGQKNYFSGSFGTRELSDIGKYWLAGLLLHSAALSCLMAPAVSCRKRYSKYSKDSKETVNAKWAYNDNSGSFNIKCHGGKGIQIENKLGSATANPYLVLAATIAAGLDGIKRKLSIQDVSEEKQNTSHLKALAIPLKLEDALAALEEDLCIREALGDTFIRYFVTMKRYELETEEIDAERKKYLEYFI
ncbi:PREDICTED: lengsin [Crocodylus porosus]|uniref:lengsin n=1 Tax=Crocodylus porosus TaxID=8502 RepID=UPI00093BD665|nr:PREDICTED: lengsin [Crocodylus porosus]